MTMLSHIAGVTSLEGTEHANEDRFCCLSGQLGVLSGVSLFGVFDGHGGSLAAQHVSSRLPKMLEEKLIAVARLHSELERSFSSSGGSSSSEVGGVDDEKVVSGDEDSHSLSADESSPSSSISRQVHNLPSGLVQQCLVTTFEELERELLTGNKKDQSGTTAIVCLMIRNRLYTATVGDSKALLSKTSSIASCMPSSSCTTQLGLEHKPTRGPEKRRIEKAGGFVEDGRTFGILAMSRCLGDRRLKGYTHKSAQEIPQQDASSHSASSAASNEGRGRGGKSRGRHHHHGGGSRGGVRRIGGTRGAGVSSKHKRSHTKRKQKQRDSPRSDIHCSGGRKKPSFPIGALIAEPHVSVEEIDPKVHKLLIVATDGLWDVMNHSAVVSYAANWLKSQRRDAKGYPSEHPCFFSLSSALATRAKHYLSRDDITVICVWFGDTP